VTFEVEIDGRTHAVSVERVPGQPHRYCVVVDEVAHHVDAVRPDPSSWSLLLPDSGACWDVAFAPGRMPGELALSVASETVLVTVNGRRTRRVTDEVGPAGEQRIVAPMPGRVLRVLVAPGDEVTAHQPLVVVEAMKMENELSSPKPGRIKDVAVAEGMSVEAGRLLVVVE
jgi:biotin carboxyl carrier protein